MKARRNILTFAGILSLLLSPSVFAEDKPKEAAKAAKPAAAMS
jgi:hypothetical protein